MEGNGGVFDFLVGKTGQAGTFPKMKYVTLLVLLGLIGAGIGRLRDFNAQPAPRAVFTTITGKKIALEDLRGKPVIVTFWATDCPACIEEIPYWTALYRQFHDRGLELIAVSMYYDPPSHVVGMAQAGRLPYDVALDLTGEQARAFGNVELIPTTFVIDLAGRIVERKTGAADPDNLTSLIKKLLEK
jgi:peroxiredoxin